MGFFTRMLIPRKVRRAVHPVRAVKRAATPKSIKKARRALHPIDNAVYSLERSLNTKPRKRRSSTSAAKRKEGTGVPPWFMLGESPHRGGSR